VRNSLPDLKDVFTRLPVHKLSGAQTFALLILAVVVIPVTLFLVKPISAEMTKVSAVVICALLALARYLSRIR
jgi:hypothetical protein